MARMITNINTKIKIIQATITQATAIVILTPVITKLILQIVAIVIIIPINT